MGGISVSSMADLPYYFSVENTATNYAAPPLPVLSSQPLIQPLPDPFYYASDPMNIHGTASTNFSDWEHHRSEILAQIQNYEIGTKPAVDMSNIFASYSGSTLTVRVTNYVSGVAKTCTLTCNVSFPTGGTSPYPVCIGMDSPYGSLDASDFTSRGIAGITYSESQVSTYNNPQNTDPFFQLYGPTQNISNTGQYAAWAWGVSRVIDGLYKLNGVLGTKTIDLTHICVTGCSYAGKLALFSGAMDERIALTVAQESGGGGDTSWRYSHTEPVGTVEDIDDTSYQWFSTSRMQQYSGTEVSYLPVDHHELVALCAPRGVYCTANTGYTWLSNPSAYVCDEAAQKIYATLGIPDRCGFNVDGGHNHCDFPSDQENDLAYMLNKFMMGQTNLSSVLSSNPYGSTVNYSPWTAWWGTTTPIFPQIYLTIPAAATKGDGTLAGQGKVRVSLAPTNIVINLTSSDPSKVIVPASIVISTGQSNAVFDLTVPGDSLLDGDQVVTITADGTNLVTAQANIIIHDTNTATLAVTLPATAYQSSGTLTNAGMVSIGTPVAANVTVFLNISDPQEVIMPGYTVISNGQTSATFNLSLVNTHIIEGPQTVTVSASVPNWTGGSNSMAILNTNPLPDHYSWSVVPSPQFIGAPFPVTITAEDAANNPLDYRLPVTLSALIASGDPGTNTILNSPSAEDSSDDETEYSLGYSFTPNTILHVTGVRSYCGDKVSIWTASGQLLTSQPVTSIDGTWVDTPLPAPLTLYATNTYLVMAHVNAADGWYYWSGDLPTTFPDGTIHEDYWDYGDVFPTQTDPFRWYFVDLRYNKDFVSVPVNPGTTPNFSSGTWSGNVAVLQAATNVMLQASAGNPSLASLSAAFNVIAKPSVVLSPINNSFVISWPISPVGFNLLQSTDLVNWVPDPVTPTPVGGLNIVTNAIGTGSMFYRLSNQ